MWIRLSLVFNIRKTTFRKTIKAIKRAKIHTISELHHVRVSLQMPPIRILFEFHVACTLNVWRPLLRLTTFFYLWTCVVFLSRLCTITSINSTRKCIFIMPHTFLFLVKFYPFICFCYNCFAYIPCFVYSCLMNSQNLTNPNLQRKKNLFSNTCKLKKKTST